MNNKTRKAIRKLQARLEVAAGMKDTIQRTSVIEEVRGELQDFSYEENLKSMNVYDRFGSDKASPYEKVAGLLEDAANRLFSLTNAKKSIRESMSLIDRSLAVEFVKKIDYSKPVLTNKGWIYINIMKK